MSEYRQDRRSGAWVIVAPGRGRRPEDRPAPPARAELPGRDPTCPFCPGNEDMLPGILVEAPAMGALGWALRVVPNKYPALRVEDGPMRVDIPPGGAAPGFGAHEVIIETPRHDLDLCDLPNPTLATLMATYRARYTALAMYAGVKAVVVFRNRGRRAGASLNHPHSQIIATGMLPPHLAASAAWARAWYARTGQCPTCAELAAEAADGRRVIEATRHFVAFVPFAAAGPFEIRIVPRRHGPSFAQADDDEMAELGPLLGRTVRRLNAVLGRPPYNYAVESGLEDTVDAASFHWCVRIIPSLLTPGGFEIASDMPINPSSPEDDAAILRATAANAPDEPYEDHHDPALEH